jgi:uncharacterized membrane protein
MRRPRRIPFGSVPPAALAGVVLGHMLAYLAVFPHAADRRAVLAVTGHSYWATAEAIAIVCALVSVLGTIARHVGLAKRHEPAHDAWAHYRSSALQLAALQSAIFLVQETLERVHVGAPLSGLLHDGFIGVGIVMQVLVAMVLALILTVLGLTAEAIGRALARSRVARRMGQPVARPTQVFARRDVAAGRYRTRAPPLSSPLTV